MDASWAEWGSWSSCSRTCGGGVRKNLPSHSQRKEYKYLFQRQSRSRRCNRAEHGGSTAVCTNTQTTSRDCNTNGCREFLNFLQRSFPQLQLCFASLEISTLAIILILVRKLFWRQKTYHISSNQWPVKRPTNPILSERVRVLWIIFCVLQIKIIFNKYFNLQQLTRLGIAGAPGGVAVRAVIGQETVMG